MKFDIKEVLVAGDRVIVRGEVTGTPAGELFGVPHTGKSFRMMAIDIQTIKDGKIAKTYHLENWLSALGQLAPVIAAKRLRRLCLIQSQFGAVQCALPQRTFLQGHEHASTLRRWCVCRTLKS